MSNESEAQKANELLLVRALGGLLDSQFLGWAAMMFAMYVDSMSEDV